MGPVFSPVTPVGEVVFSVIFRVLLFRLYTLLNQGVQSFMLSVTHSLLPEVGSDPSKDVAMEGRLVSHYTLRRSMPRPTGKGPSPP